MSAPDELVEAVARAICVSARMNDDDPLGGWRHWVREADAAFEAIDAAGYRIERKPPPQVEKALKGELP